MFWPFTVWINCSSDFKKVSNSRLSASNSNSKLFFLTVGQKNFGNKILCWFFRKLPQFSSEFFWILSKYLVRLLPIGVRFNWYCCLSTEVLFVNILIYLKLLLAVSNSEQLWRISTSFSIKHVFLFFFCRTFNVFPVITEL